MSCISRLSRLIAILFFGLCSVLVPQSAHAYTIDDLTAANQAASQAYDSYINAQYDYDSDIYYFEQRKQELEAELREGLQRCVGQNEYLSCIYDYQTEHDTKLAELEQVHNALFQAALDAEYAYQTAQSYADGIYQSLYG